jgi:hypothetical protein
LGHFTTLATLLELLNFFLLTGNLFQPAIDLPESFSLLPDFGDPGSGPLRLQASEPDALLIEPHSLLLFAFVFELNQVFVHGLDVELPLAIVLFNDLLDLLHFLIEHIEQLSILFVFDFSLPQLLLAFLQLFLKMVVLDFQVQIADPWLDFFFGQRLLRRSWRPRLCA